ncbi:MAG TPA: hypothetical protein VIZ18_00390 [Ktedonobacteraceae bacterium]
MRNQIVTDSSAATHEHNAELLEKTFFFHDIAVHCRTNHSQILAWLAEMLDAFPKAARIRGEVQYAIFCYDEAARFPMQLPPARQRTDAIELLTGTILKYYRSPDSALEYHSYRALEGVNSALLTVIERDAPIVTTQLERLERYRPSFLRRYVFLLALGHVMTRFGFEPFHAAAITAPWDDHQGALLVGASGSGKTTLSVGCAISGCGLLGDDLVMLRAQEQDNAITACVVSHEVAVRSRSLQLWDALAFLAPYPADERDKRYCSINDIRAGSARLETPIRLLLFPTLTGEARSRVIPMSKAQALQALIEQTISKGYQHHHTPATLFGLLVQLAQQATSYQVLISRGANDGPTIVKSLFAGERYG